MVGWTSWSVDPFALLTVILAVFYFRGVRNWRKRSRPHSGWRTASFAGGVIAVIIALLSPIDVLAEQYFLFHQIQHILLRMIGPVLIMLGAPVTPILRGLPSSTRSGVVRPLVTSDSIRLVYEIVTNPLFVTISFVGVFIFWMIPGPHDWAVDDGKAHLLMHGTLFSVSMLFWWEIIDPKPRKSRMHYGPRTLILGLVAIPNTIVSAGITYSDEIIYKSYSHAGAIWSLQPLTDQQAGGVTGWLIVDMMSILGAGIVFTKWYKNEMNSQRSKIRNKRRRMKT